MTHAIFARLTPLSTRTQAWATLAALALVWGSSYILIKKSLVGFEAWQVGCLRITLAGVAFVPLAWRYCRGLSAKRWMTLATVGLFGTGLPSFLFPLAQRELSSSLAAGLSSLTPLMTLLVATLAFGMRLGVGRIVGVVVGLVGALVLVAGRFGVPGGAGAVDGEAWPLPAIAFATAATLCYAISSNIVKRFLSNVNALQVSAGAMVPLGLVGAMGLALGGGLPTGVAPAADLSLADLYVAYAAVAFLALLGTGLASWLFFRLIQLTDPVFASTVSYLVPIVAFAWGLADGEAVTLIVAAGLGLILLGVSLSKR